MGRSTPVSLKALAQAAIARNALRQTAPQKTPLPPDGSPAYSILETCQRCGVALRLDPTTGDLVVGKAGAKADEPTQPWPGLLAEIEAQLESVARLVESGWTLKAGFPRHDAA